MGLAPNKKKQYKGAKIAAINADNDEYLKKTAMINQVLAVANPNIGLIPNKTPAAVATPLPPLKR